MSALLKSILSPAEYLAIERAAETNSQFFDGEMFEMAGTTKPAGLFFSSSCLAQVSRMVF